MSDITTVIGRNELVNFVDHAVADVPAKIDTGADSCAVWATNIREDGGQLKFTLFGAGSIYYTGTELTTDRYKVVGVKNSFGEREVRYTVWLSIILNSKRYKVRFNLADRSRNHFPILLGKRFLNKRFLVDVSTNYLLSGPRRTSGQRVLVLTTRLNDDVIKFFDEVSSELPGELDICHYDDLVFRVGGQPCVLVAATGVDLADYDLVYFKSRRRRIEQAMTVASYLRYRNVIYRDDELDSMISHSKLSEMMQLSTHDLPVPLAMVAQTNYLANEANSIAAEFGLPLVLKDVFSDRGKNNYFVKTTAELKRLLKDAPDACLFAVQKYVVNDGFLRVLVMGRDIDMVVERQTVKHKDPLKEHLNKPSGSTNAHILPNESLDSVVRSIVLKASDVMRRQVAGVDVLQDKTTGKWYILEVNSSPQLLGGKFEKQKAVILANYFKRELERW